MKCSSTKEINWPREGEELTFFSDVPIILDSEHPDPILIDIKPEIDKSVAKG